MKHVLLSDITIVPEEIAIGILCSDDTLINSNQANAFIDTREHGDWDISFGIWKSCDKMSIFLGVTPII